MGASVDTETVVIWRSSPTARLQVDQDSQDVISQVCLTARSYAFIHEQELFQATKANRTGFSRSNSGLSMAGMGRLSKHERVRAPRRRIMESLDSLIPKGSSPLGSTMAEKRIGKKLSITSVSLKMTISLLRILQVRPALLPLHLERQLFFRRIIPLFLL